MTATRLRVTRLGAVRLRVALVVGLAVVLVGTGTGTSWALWSASQSFGQTATLGKLSASLGGVDGLGTTFAEPSSSVTAPVTFRNTGNVAATASVATRLAPTNTAASTTLASEITVTAWPVSSPSNCTADAPVGAGATTGSWASPPALGPSGLTAGASSVWCVRTTPTAKAPARATVNPSLTLTLSAGSWRSSASAGAYQNTAATYPTVQTAVCRTDGPAYAWLDFDPSSRATATRYATYVGSTRVSNDEQTGDYPHFAFTRDDLPADPFGDGRIAVDIRVMVDGRPTDLMAVGTLEVVYDEYGTRNIQCG